MAKRKSPKPYKALHQPEFEYIASLIEDGGDKETNASIARRTGRSETTVARIRAVKTWDVYNGSDKTKAPRKRVPAKSTTTGQGQLAGLHKHVGRVESKVNEVLQYLDRQDANSDDLESLKRGQVKTLLSLSTDLERMKRRLASLNLVVWMTFLFVSILLFIVVRVVYVS